MLDQDNRTDGATGIMTRRWVVAMAAIAAFGLTMGASMLPSFAQGRMEMDVDRDSGREVGRDGDRLREDDRFGDRYGERRFEGKRDSKWDAKAVPEANWEGKAEDREGKEGRKPGNSGHIKLTVGGDGATAVDIKCPDGEPMRACADITKEIIDKIRPPK
jgi:hypothetical protein